MACYKPLTAWQRQDGSVTWDNRGDVRELTLPCSRCIGCRLEKSRQWAVRCMHEAKLHRHNSFVTLTYAPEHLPDSGSLRKSDAVKFLKRLREAAFRQHQEEFPPGNRPVGRGGILTSTSTAEPEKRERRASQKPLARRPLIRFYLAGEYGERFGRPHFHICLFNCDFSDKHYLAKTPSGSKLYRSPTLEQLWKFGHSSVGELTFESAAYAARYIMKKQTGDGEKQEYKIIDPDTGEIYSKVKEYNNMSRRPGLGREWFNRYHRDWYPEGKLIVRGKEANTPRYYDRMYRQIDPLGHEDLQLGRYLEMVNHWQDNTDARLQVKEQVTAAKISQLKRRI